MAELKNARHEAFAQLYAKGERTAAEAYRAVYPKVSVTSSDAAASRLLGTVKVAERVRELQQLGASVIGPTVERIVKELERIAFADIRKAVVWHSALVKEEDNPDGGDTLVVRHIFSNHVMLKGSDEISDDVAAAIQSVEQAANGALKIKFYSKDWALKLLAQYKGMLQGDSTTVNVQNNTLNVHAPVDRPAKETYEDFTRRRRLELGGPARGNGNGHANGSGNGHAGE